MDEITTYHSAYPGSMYQDQEIDSEGYVKYADHLSAMQALKGKLQQATERALSYCNCLEPYFGARPEGTPIICERCMKEVGDTRPSLRQQLAEAEARVRVLDNTLDVERDAFRNMQMQKEALEARVKELEEHSAVCEKHPLYQCALVTEEGVDWVLEFDDSGTGPETILEDARAALADERKEAPDGD